MNTLFQEKLKETLAVVKDLTCQKRPTPELSKYENILARWSKAIFSHQLFGFCTAIILACLSYYLHDPTLASTALATVTLSQLLGVLLSLVAIATGVPFVYRLLKSPFSQFFKIIEISIETDLVNLEKLKTCDTEAIRFVLVQYEIERLAFEKRCSILIGSLEKIGFLPAVAGLCTLSISLSKSPALQSWANALIFLMVAFYFLSAAAFMMMQKQDRVIALLKYHLKSAE